MTNYMDITLYEKHEFAAMLEWLDAQCAITLRELREALDAGENLPISAPPSFHYYLKEVFDPVSRTMTAAYWEQENPISAFAFVQAHKRALSAGEGQGLQEQETSPPAADVAEHDRAEVAKTSLLLEAETKIYEDASSAIKKAGGDFTATAKIYIDAADAARTLKERHGYDD